MFKKIAEPDKNKIKDNVYLQSRAMWQDIYGNAENRYKWSRRINFLLIIVVLIGTAGLISLGHKSKIVPYVVLMKGSDVLATGSPAAGSFDTMKPELARYFIQQFITSSHSVSVDGFIEKQQIETAYALTRGNATSELDDYFRKNNPTQVAQTQIITVQIYYVNSLPNNVFEVGWTQDTKDALSGADLGTKKYVGQFSYAWGNPSSDSLILKYNPFGFYVQTISITQVLN